jgi:Lon protease-like protein
MSGFEESVSSLEGFSGKVRLFPLPDLVLFPHVMQPLHVFEPRYRELLEDALSDDRLIAMALLAPGWESDYEGRPPVFPVACLGQITTCRRLDDGTYNLLLLGLRRVNLVRELRPTRSFRVAEAELCADRKPPRRASLRTALRRNLRKALLQMLPLLPEAEEQLDQLLGDDVSLGVLTDVISYLLDLDIQDKESLLVETDVYRRAELLLDHLSVALASHDSGQWGTIAFPPQFSFN